ncbi:hypothetical protein ACFL02_10420 [Planctomycetota bacterium]
MDSIRIEGELNDVPGDAGNKRLSETTYVYDALDRLIKTKVKFFDPNSQNGIGDGKVVTITEYNGNSQVVRVINDNGHETTSSYDTAHRLSVVTDAKGNIAAYSYDQNSNVLTIIEVEKSDMGSPDEDFVTTNMYDNLDRLTGTTDNDENPHTYDYDSRDNRTLVIDALTHKTRYEYDGLNRLIQTVRDMNNNGANPADPCDIVTYQTWDDNSRLISRSDDNGNPTAYVYDALNRQTSEQYADGTLNSSTYDVHDNCLTFIDANGSKVIRTYDLLNRPTNKTIVRGANIEDTTFERYEYDGLSRMVSAEDNDSLVTFSYDSLSNPISETLNGRTTARVYDGVGNQTQITYPGGRIINISPDELSRKKTIEDTNETIATYNYIGGRVEKREYGNGIDTDYTYDNVKRIIGTTHTKTVGGVIIDKRTYQWDANYNKIQRRDERIGGPQLTHKYTYDPIYRLEHTTMTGAGAILVRDTDYDLDGVGNFLTNTLLLAATSWAAQSILIR